ncbi:MAG: substrate-binding domain-containing protein [Lachnospiraceae bacterium]|nr:substrate-binding domain-containing protein [Lachnospiraceae bacterium]
MNSRIFKKLLSLAVVSFVFVSTLTSCGSNQGNSADGVKVKLIMTDTKDAFRKNLSDNIKEQASSQGVNLTMVNTGDDVDKQAKEVRKAKSEGYKAIILRLSDAETALQMNVASNGLPIIYVNTQPNDEHLSDSEYIYVGSKEQDAGKYQADYVYKKLNNPSSFNAIIFEGEKGHSGTIGRTSAVKKFFRQKNVSVNYVFMDYANWTSEEAKAKFNTFMKTKQSVDAIFCNNDTMAIGAVEALKENGLDPKKIPVCGVDASKEGCQSIVDGDMSFTVLQDAETQAEMAVKCASLLGKGKSIKDVKYATDDGKYIWVPFKPVDSSNASQYK